MTVSTVLWALDLLLTAPLLASGVFSCYWATYAWHSPENYERTKFVKTKDSHQFSFSVIVPLREEILEVMRATVGCLLAQTHGNVQTVLSVGFDDPGTLANASIVMAEYPQSNIVLSVSLSPVHNKPTQLNAALQECTGDIVGILDAESLSAPDLLGQVDAVFQEAGVSVVQGGVIMTNYRDSWVSLRSSLEYYVHHRSKMHFSSAHGSLLMGGNTIFFKRSLLEELHGWNELILAEDAEISLRLQTLGHEVTVAYDPHLVSREEAPLTVRAWVKQRTRWNLGFLQIIQSGVWKHLPTRRQQRMALWNLLQPTVMSVTGIAIPIAVVTYIWADPPLVIAMVTWIPAFPTIFTVVVDVIMLRSFTREHGDGAARVRDYVKLLVSVPVYQLLLSFASIRAVFKYVRHDLRWEKSEHVGAHLAHPVMEESK